MVKANLLCNIPADLAVELVQTIVASGNIRIERIVSKGHQSPSDFWYDQDQNEWVLLAKGEARLQFQNQTLHLTAGDYVNITAHQKHRVAWTTPDEETVWLAIFYG
jgi:cupin 2 domain-containing protein